MPYMYVDPAVFVEIDGVEIYHAYRHGVACDMQRWHYQVKDDDFVGFDIRDVSYHATGLDVDLSTPEGHKEALRRAFRAARQCAVSFVEWLESHDMAYNGEG